MCVLVDGGVRGKRRGEMIRRRRREEGCFWGKEAD
jgi:hypothetical protein